MSVLVFSLMVESCTSLPMQRACSPALHRHINLNGCTSESEWGTMTQVLQVQPAPHSLQSPWDSCVAVVGADGIVGICTLLDGGSCLRVLPGHSPGCPLQLQWASSLGFLACMSNQANAGAIAVVWDLQSGVVGNRMLAEVCRPKLSIDSRRGAGL